MAGHALSVPPLLSSRRKENPPRLPPSSKLYRAGWSWAFAYIRPSLSFTRGAKPDKINGRKKMHKILFQERHRLKRERKSNDQGKALGSSN